MMAILYDSMSEDYDKFSDEELIAESEEYYPHLLPEPNISELDPQQTTTPQANEHGLDD